MGGEGRSAWFPTLGARIQEAGPLQQAQGRHSTPLRFAQDDSKDGAPSGIFVLEFTFGLEKRDDE